MHILDSWPRVGQVMHHKLICSDHSSSESAFWANLDNWGAILVSPFPRSALCPANQLLPLALKIPQTRAQPDTGGNYQ